jgi:hypothetical protein
MSQLWWQPPRTRRSSSSIAAPVPRAGGPSIGTAMSGSICPLLTMACGSSRRRSERRRLLSARRIRMTVDPSSSRDPQRCDPGAQDDISQTIVAAAGISSDALRGTRTP